ncbi:hypothetical protein ACJDT4_00320 [Clostridium neuense]|uniref:Uncharacterized protein n=1 Tax=Clostridium neuense TaxID=1728934 RepID=A0ABW8TCZ2_9CLOT
MGENCKDCVQVENIKADIKDIYERLREVEKFSSSGGEQIKMIFKMLNEIKGSLDKIGDKLENIDKNAVNTAKVEELEKEIEEIRFKPVEDYSKTKIAVITSVCSSIVGAILGFVFSKI